VRLKRPRFADHFAEVVFRPDTLTFRLAINSAAVERRHGPPLIASRSPKMLSNGRQSPFDRLHSKLVGAALAPPPAAFGQLHAQFPR